MKIMKVDLKNVMSQETRHHFVHRVRVGLHLAAQWLLILHGHALDIVAVALVLVLAMYLVVTLLYLAPPGVNATPPGRSELATDVIDRLELWIEQRDAILSSGLSVPKGVL